MAVPTIALLSLLSLIIFTSPSSANEGNILVTGDVLTTNNQLSYGSSAFTIQDDCNLVLYNKGNGFQSNTYGKGSKCNLTLTNFGELVITNENGIRVWSTPASTKKGNYAAILDQEGQVKIFGPSITSFSRNLFWSSSSHTANKESNNPLDINVLFSSQILEGDSKLVSRDYALSITDCDLEFRKESKGAVWWSMTKGKGKNCFARLNHWGQFSVLDDLYNVLWSSNPGEVQGEYALAVLITGKVEIFGPLVWSTAE